MSYSYPINQSVGNVDNAGAQGKADTIDVIDETGAYMALIRDNLEYEHHMRYGGNDDKEMYEEIYETVCDVVCVKRRTLRINGEDYPYELVKSRFLKLNSSHVEYVMGCMRETTTKITNIRAYLITALYNAPSTMSHYGVLDTMSRGGKKQNSLFFRLFCIWCKISDVIQGKAFAQNIQYHVQRVGGNGLVIFQPLNL